MGILESFIQEKKNKHFILADSRITQLKGYLEGGIESLKVSEDCENMGQKIKTNVPEILC